MLLDNRITLPQPWSGLPVIHLPQASLLGAYNSHSESTQVRVRQVHIWSTDGWARKWRLLPRVCKPDG